jgi:hypothetical protein
MEVASFVGTTKTGKAAETKPILKHSLSIVLPFQGILDSARATMPDHCNPPVALAGEQWDKNSRERSAR